MPLPQVCLQWSQSALVKHSWPIVAALGHPGEWELIHVCTHTLSERQSGGWQFILLVYMLVQINGIQRSYEMSNGLSLSCLWQGWAALTSLLVGYLWPVQAAVSKWVLSPAGQTHASVPWRESGLVPDPELLHPFAALSKLGNESKLTLALD